MESSHDSGKCPAAGWIGVGLQGLTGLEVMIPNPRIGRKA
jgi:hypothetical protein